ncbi:arylsulfatase B-like [Mercenaria mercenaria]|uniref:arylsulfatase B-like n=1 Tax=Mercenaria mercenaria TaxID=6596 RepID=UPI00234E985D|nr:arylsulfatase B-like [Mercenaria mercenaria]
MDIMTYTTKRLFAGVTLCVLVLSLLATLYPGHVLLLLPNYTDNDRSGNFVQQSSPDSIKPHILLIVADDLGFNDVGYHGSMIKTPNIDKLALSGVRLENYYVQPVCTPTRGQLLSGRYQIHTGLQWVLWPGTPLGLALDSPTIADKLREAGYSTHIVGKWHVGFFKKEYLPTNRGFDSFFGLLAGHSDYFTHRTGHGRMSGFDLMENDQPVDITKYNGSYSTTLFTNKVKHMIQKHDSDKPLFVFLPYQAVHGPLQVPVKYLEQYENVNNSKRKTYAGMVSCMDEGIGEIVESLKQRGMWNNTVLIFTTDNGGDVRRGASNSPLRGGKGSLWEGGIRAAGFVHSMLLDEKMAGSVSKELMHVTDWFPTLVKLAGGHLNGTKPLDGFDQWETIKYGAKTSRREILHDINPRKIASIKPLYNNTFNTTMRASIRIGEWKLLTGYQGKQGPKVPSNQSTWLFNIKKDPWENKELSMKYPEKVQDMLNRLKHYEKGMVPCPLPKEDPRANPSRRNGFWEPWM